MTYRSLALVLALLLALPAAAQDVPAVGAPGSLDVATWNIEWFGSSTNGPGDDAAQLRYVTDVIAGADVDLWALQEIADEGAFAALLSELGDGFGGVLATNSGPQRVAFVYRTSTIRVRSAGHLLEQYDYAFAGRPPLQLEAEVTLPDTTFDATFVVVHMKAFSDRESYERRVEAAQRLKNRFDFFEARTPLLLLGDFNDEVLRSTYAAQPSPFAPFVDDGDYAVLTRGLEEASRATFCGSSIRCTGTSTIDHVIATDEFAALFLPGSAARYDALLDAIPSYVFTTSDHLPVLVRFAAEPASVASEREAAAPHAEPPFPNPSDGRVTVPYVLERPGAASIAVYDLLGRRVLARTLGARGAGAHAEPVEVPGPPGIYLVRVGTGAHVTTHRIVKRDC